MTVMPASSRKPFLTTIDLSTTHNPHHHNFMKTQSHLISRRIQIAFSTNLSLALLALFGFLLPSARAQTPVLVLNAKWSLPAGSRFDLDTGNLTRGVAINKLTGNVLLASRVTTNHVSIINGADGSDLGTLNSTGISGGTLGLDLIGVADDGVIYAANLAAATSTLKIYRWNSEADGIINPPTTALTQIGVLQRYGDSMDIRGAGTNTQIIISGSSSTVFGIATTADGTNFILRDIPHNLGAGELSKGITFDGTNNALYGKRDGSATLHKISFDIGTGTAALITNITLTGDTALIGTKFGSSNGVSFVVGELSSTGTSAHHLKAYTINNPSSPVVSADIPFPTPYTGNGNLVGSSDIGLGMVVGNDVNNGLLALTIAFLTNVAPSVVNSPQDQTNVLQGGFTSFSVSANGTTQLRYQWRFNDTNNLAGATNATLPLTNLDLTNSGLYSVVITNVAGSITSAPATLSVVPAVLTSAAVPIWKKSVGDLFFLTADDTQRGLAYNPATGHLIVVSRTPTNGIHVLNAATGAYISSLDMSAVTLLPPTVTFAIDMVGVADDGAIYVADLDVSGVNYVIYRWADENPSTVATIAFGPNDPCGCGRVGDTLTVRGSGVNTQILISSRNGSQVILFTTFDGQTFNSNIIDTSPEPPQLAGLGIAFGAGDTFWTKSSGFQFRHFAYDLTANTNGLLQTFASGQSTAIALAVDPINDLIAGLVPNTTTRPLPDHIDLYDVHSVLTGESTEPALIDEDFFQTANPDLNGVGSLAFDVAGGRLFALDTNNGLLAPKVVPRLFNNTPHVLTWTGPSTLQSATAVLGPYTDIGGSSSPYTNSVASPAQFFRLKR